MKKHLLVFLSLLAIVWAGRMIHTVTFSPNDLFFSTSDAYDLVTLNGTLTTEQEGKPLLPMVNLNLLIPASAEIRNVSVRSYDKYEIPGKYYIHPVQTPRPLSTQNPPPFVEPDPETYASAESYPDRIAEMVPSGSMSGYRIAGILVYPLQYVPSEKKLILYTRLELEIEYEDGVNEVVSLSERQLKEFGERVQKLVVNPEDVEALAPPLKQSLNYSTIDYVIITSNSLASAFTPLKNWLTKKGFNTVVMPTETVYVRYAGRDDQEKIRNFIIDYWRNKGLVWVLIGGDDIVVPVRLGYLTDPVHSTGSIPTDLYYADLQWSWDGNRNNQFGEFTGDTLDLFYDVFVGRAPVDNANHVANFIRKDTLYEKRPDTTYIKRILLEGEWLWSSIGYHGRICNGNINGFLPVSWRRSRIDDPTGAQIRDSLNVGYNFCHVVGHGAPTQVGYFTIDLVSTLTNATKLDIMNSIACDCGSFDAKECMAETLINFPGGGCVADILNSRFGWGAPPLMGSSEQLDCAFYRMLILKNAWEVGLCHALAKDDLRNIATTQYAARWSHYALNLFGDPCLPMWTDTPKTMVVNFPSVIQTGPQMVRVIVTTGGNPVKNAHVCIMKGTECHAAGYTNSLGWIELMANATTSGNMDLTVTARNCYPAENIIVVNSGAARPCLAFQSLFVNDGNNNRLDPGETADLYLTLKNAGTAVASNVRGTLRTTSSFITLVDSTSNYGNIIANDTSRGDFYRATVSSAAPQGTEAEFIVNAVANEGTWQPFVKTFIGLPRPEGRLWATHDTAWLLLSVTCVGSIGTTDWHGEGHGFIYPDTAAWSSSKLWHGSMVCGTDPTYMVDRFYGVPCSIINKDFRVVDSLREVRPPTWGHEEYLCTYDDGYHAAPRGLQVVQRSLALYDAGYDDFVIIVYDYYNRGTSAINNFYSSVWCDYWCTMWNQLDNSDYGFVDASRRFAFLKNSSTTRNHSYGLRLLDPRTARNVSLINLSLYTGLNEATKDSFVSAKRTVTSGLTPTNLAVIGSAGPINLGVGQTWRCAYAIVGGHDTTQAKAHSDSAQSWYDRFLGVQTEQALNTIAGKPILIKTRIFNKALNIFYELEQNQRVVINVYDASGRFIETAFDKTGAAKGVAVWKPRHLAGGIYFLRIADQFEKIIYIR